MTILVVGVLIAPAAALASSSFTDVETSDFFSAAVDWMADNGVTVGCNPPQNTRYCPDDSVTRGQMAVFLERLDTRDVFMRPAEVKAAYLGKNQQAADADKVDGLDAADLRTLVWAQRDTDFGGTDRSVASQVINSVAIDVPTDGVLVISGHVFLRNREAVAAEYVVVPLLNGSQATTTDVYGYVELSQSGDDQQLLSASYTATVPITAGSHTVAQEVRNFDELTQDFFHNGEELVVTFHPAASSTLTASTTTALTTTNSDGD